MGGKSGRWIRKAQKASDMTGDKVLEVRQALGDTQRAFAERVGVATNTVTRWENDTMPVGRTAAILIRLLGQLHRKEHKR
jgi:transcriptional regulator with XRE-family HTH domain